MLLGWSGYMVETLMRDVVYGLRMLRKTPALTAIVTITLALGIGANTAIFSVMNGWLLRPLPITAPHQIAVLAFSQQKEGSNFSFPDLLDFRKQSDTFSDLFAYGLGVAGLSANGKANEFAYSAVTGNYFSALGIKPLLGRFFLPGEGEESGEELLVVLGYSYWQKKFGGDSSVVGKQVIVNGKAAAIIGVAPKEFHGTLFFFDMDGYLPLSAMAADLGSSSFWTDKHDRRLTVLARLKPGVSFAQAQSSADLVAARLADQYAEAERKIEIRVIPERLARPASSVASFVPVIASLFLALPAFLLLLACANVAIILLARTTVRRREMAIRVALGAGRGRLIRQMLTECFLLTLFGGVAGVIFGKWAIAGSGSILHSVTSTSNFAYKLDSSFDWRVFAYALAAAFLATIFAGGWPALRASRANVNEMFHERGQIDSSSSRRSFRGLLVVAQVAGSLTLLIVAGLFVRGLGSAKHMYLGFDPEHVLNVMMDPHQIGLDEKRTRIFYRQLEKRVQAMPGVESASLAFAVPLAYPGHSGRIYLEGDAFSSSQQPPEISFNSVDSDYFETMRVPLLRGRAFAESDDEKSIPVAIINRMMARRMWPNENPIGKRFSLKGVRGPFIEVVGVAENGQYLFLSPNPQPYFYVPLTQNFSSFLSLQVRSSGRPESIITGLQEEIRGLAPDLPIIDMRTMPQIVQGLAGLFVFRLAASLASVLGFLGLTLAVAGVYGIVSFEVGQRTHEIGIRVALGAERSQIMRLALGQGLKLVGAGLGAGLFASWIVAHAISKLLIGVSGSDLVTYTTVSIMLLVVTLLACWIPARRALLVDPVVALRYE
jgi:macrolide transport system ATP-binding/permease protein